MSHSRKPTTYDFESFNCWGYLETKDNYTVNEATENFNEQKRKLILSSDSSPSEISDNIFEKLSFKD